jgi:dipeptidyl aminopeptidase/acylaminoacyl peptidase
MSLPSYYMPNPSWKKDKLCYFSELTGRIELYVVSLDKPLPLQLSHGEMPRSLRTWTVWERNDESVIFGKDVDGNEQHDLYRIRLKDSSVERLTNDPTSEKHALDPSPDGRWLLIMGNIAGRGGKRQLNLWRLDLKGGGLEQVTDCVNPVSFPVCLPRYFSPDGKWIAYGTNETDDTKNADVYRCQADGSNPELLFRGKIGSQDYPGAWSPDGRSLGISSDMTGTTRPGIMDLSSRSVRWLGQEGRDEFVCEFSPDGRQLLALSNAGMEASRPHVYEVSTGEELALDLPPGCYDAQFASVPGQLLLFYTDVGAPTQCLTYDMRTARRRTILPPITKGIDPKQLVGCETVRYPSFDGRSIEALLFRPKEISQSKSSPAIVEVHGGPTGQFSRIFNPVAQFLVSQGYTVLEPNVRGSTGYGSEFRDLNRKDWGGGDLEDVVKGADFLRILPGIDPKRVGIYGGSYGGYMTYMAVVKRPDAWKAACAIVGITDLNRMYDSAKEHFRYFLKEQMGDPVSDAALWKDRSAVNFAQNLKTKLLMLHGVNDPRCPVEQARVFRDRLLVLGRKQGEDFEYEEYGDEGHGSMDIQHKIRMYGRMAQFFQKEL